MFDFRNRHALNFSRNSKALEDVGTAGERYAREDERRRQAFKLFATSLIRMEREGAFAPFLVKSAKFPSD